MTIADLIFYNKLSPFIAQEDVIMYSHYFPEIVEQFDYLFELIAKSDFYRSWSCRYVRFLFARYRHHPYEKNLAKVLRARLDWLSLQVADIEAELVFQELHDFFASIAKTTVVEKISA